MKILEILPSHIERDKQMYTVVYEQDYKTYSVVLREREAVRTYKLNKAEFKRILLNSMNSSNLSDI
jgi:hypothetical protein